MLAGWAETFTKRDSAMTQQTQKERPILFSGAMVRAILEGRKAQTRRTIKGVALACLEAFTPEFVANPDNKLCPYGNPGDRLWVREAFCWPDDYSIPIYKADTEDLPPMDRWRPSIHMPRAASRIMLEITDVRAEQLKDISESDAIDEGLENYDELPICGNGFVSYAGPEIWHDTARASFFSLWQHINGPESLDENPWVWAITFKRIPQ